MQNRLTLVVPGSGYRQHFEVLDGLRGTAATAVVIFHFMEVAIPTYDELFIAHGFLAVDFFFCLSGFVIGCAYDERMRTVGLGTFLKRRVVRLQPLVVLGSVLGLVTLLVDPFASDESHYSTARLGMVFLASIFLVPYPVMAERGYNLFSLNAPSWSLFWEYIANIFYGLWLHKLQREWLAGLTVSAGLLLCVVGWRAGRLSGGWSGRHFWHGGARVAFSFLAGLLIYRSRWIIQSRLSIGSLSIMLLAALLMPYVKGGWVREATVIIFYFPLLVALGAGASLKTCAKRFCAVSGEISYPLYMTHYAVIWMFGNYYQKYHPGALRVVAVVTSGVVTMLGVAYVALRLYDAPLRKLFLRRIA